ncbi:phosphoprotein phosphatase [Aureococcus anophagefferens]|nr:phosphoprotein phosphatase [Aureococcus anophagefferens]
MATACLCGDLGDEEIGAVPVVAEEAEDQPEVMGFVICVGETIHERMLKKPMMTVLWYKSNQDFRDDMNGDLCSRSNYGMANLCKVVKVCRAKCTAHFTTSIIRGAGCNWMVCLAIWLQMIATEPISKFIMIWLPIELFISSGFDHLVVNEFLIPAGIMVGGKYSDDRCNWGKRSRVQLRAGDPRLHRRRLVSSLPARINKDGWRAGLEQQKAI